MYKIKTLNKISDIIYKHLPKDGFEISDSGDVYEAALVRSASLHETVFPSQLLAIARAGAGVNNIPLDKCADQGIVVFNSPGANANAVKEIVCCSLLLAGRDILGGIEWTKTLTDNIEEMVEKGKSNFIGSELSGKTLGVVGLGAIGVMVANMAACGLGMKVIGYDPYISVEAAWKLNSLVQQAKSIGEIFSQCDYISLHVPQTEDTKEMINKENLGLCKDGLVVLNFSRATLAKDDDVLSALSTGKLYKYITDFPNQKLQGQKGVVAIPHLGASTPESEENCAIMAACQLKSYLEDGNIVNSVNFPSCEIPRNGKYRLSIINKNVANMVGQITAVLASENINIEDMLNKSRHSWAYTLIDVNTKPKQSVLDKITSIEGVIKVRLI